MPAVWKQASPDSVILLWEESFRKAKSTPCFPSFFPHLFAVFGRNAVNFCMVHQVFKPYYDVIVIGAGVGGLTAAALLSKAGLSVCVLEKEPRVGGYLAGFRRKHFLFDTAIHWLNQYGEGGMLDKLFGLLGSDHPLAIPQTRIRRNKGEKFDFLLTNTPDELRDQLIEKFPHEKKGIERLFKQARKIGRSFKNYNRIFRSEETMSFFERLRNKLRMLEFAIPFIPYISYSGEKGLKKGLDGFFKDPRLQQLFAGEHELLGCMVPIGWAYYGDFQSPPRGGSQVIPLWLKHVVEYYKNEVVLQCSVNKILVRNGRCAGLDFDYHGQTRQIESKYVVAACDIQTLYEQMLPPDAVPEKLKKRLRQADLYSSSITVSLALDCPTEQLGFNEELIHLVDEREPYDARISGDPLTTEISIIAPSLRDKSLAPEGQGTLTLYMPAFMNYRDVWKTETDTAGNPVRGEAYQQLKREVAEVIISRVQDKIAPELRSHILFYEVATPVTHWRYTGNRDGTMMGARPGRGNMKNKISHYQTPVKNLILGGHWAELGGGVPIAAKAGANAALLILKKENQPAFKCLAGYMDNKISLETALSNKAFKSYDQSWVQPLTPAQKQRSPKRSGGA
jgi:prolycopene isomerase